MKESSSGHTEKLRLMSRRQFLRNSAAGTAGAAATIALDPAQAFGKGGPRSRVAARLAQASTPEAMAVYEPLALTADELATVRAAVGRIIPADDLGPGADQAGVHIYIDQALAGPDASMLDAYQSGLAAFNKAAGGDGFAAAAPETQDEILQFFESGGGNAGATPAAGATPGGTPVSGSANINGVRAAMAAGFVPMLIEHTRQGMFGDPVYGGNANFVGWDLIGYPGIKLNWTPDEQDIGTDVEPEHTSVEKYGGTGYE